LSIGRVVYWLGMGTLETLKLLPICIGISFVGGVVLGALHSRKVPVVNEVLNGYIFIMRGMPPLVLLLIITYVSGIAQPFLAAVCALVIYHTAYVTEIIRGGILAVARGQYMAAESLGLRSYYILWRIILPQVWCSIIPSLAGQYVLLAKDTSLVGVVGMQDLMRIAKQLMQVTNPLAVYAGVTIFYYLICVGIHQFSLLFERRLKQRVVEGGV